MAKLSRSSRAPARTRLLALGVAVAAGGFGMASSALPLAAQTEPAPITTTTAPAMPPAPTESYFLVGDSVAGSLTDGLATAAAQQGIGFASSIRTGCGLTDAQVVNTGSPETSRRCAVENDAYLADADARAMNATALMWLSSWEINDHYVNGNVLRFRSPEWDAWFTSQLERDVAMLRAHRTKLALVTIAPRGTLGNIIPMTPEEAQQTYALDDFFRSFVATHPMDATIVDMAGLLCPTGFPCPQFFDGVEVRPNDGAHFSPQGAQWAGPRVLQMTRDAILRMPSDFAMTL